MSVLGFNLLLSALGSQLLSTVDKTGFYGENKRQ
jgi:hypothetical protein